MKNNIMIQSRSITTLSLEGSEHGHQSQSLIGKQKVCWSCVEGIKRNTNVDFIMWFKELTCKGNEHKYFSWTQALGW